MRRRSVATHGDTGAAKLIAHGGPGNAQLGTDLAQGPALGVQLCRTLNVHSATRKELRQSSAFVVGSLWPAAPLSRVTVEVA